MIALSCFLFTFVCLAQSRRYYGQYNYGNQGKPLETRLYVYRLRRLDVCWDQKAFDFNMTVEISDSDKRNNINEE